MVVFVVKSIQPIRLASALTMCRGLSIPTIPLDHCFYSLVDSNGNNKDSAVILYSPVLSVHQYEEQCGILLSRFLCKPTLRLVPWLDQQSTW